jgi:myo-inositol-1(or 4)-monophosphatase
MQDQDLLDLAVAAAERAAAHIRTQTRPADPRAWDQKGLSDFVTDVDRSTERLIAAHLLDGAPGSVVLGEELSPSEAVAPLTWVVDPLDGTTNYLHGYPAYAVSIAAAVDGDLRVGAVVDVPGGQTYRARRGAGAWCGDRRLHVSAVSAPEHALIGTGFPFKVPDLLPAYLEVFDTVLRRTSGIRRGGAASLDFVDIALGRFDGFWEPYLAPWDVAAGTVIVREAGGVVTDDRGGSAVLQHGAFVAGNPALHAWLLEVTAAVRPGTESG